MDQDKTWRLRKILSQAVDKKIFPGSVVGFLTEKEREVIPFGRYTYDSDSSGLSDDSIFDVASITKTIPTSLLAIKLIEDGKIRLDDKASKFLPIIKGKWKDEIKIIHLLTQTVDYGISLSSYKNKTAHEILEIIFCCDLKSPPGKNYCYTNSSSIILGKIIEAVTGSSLISLSEQYFFDPLKMRDSTFSPGKSDLYRIAPTEIDPWRKLTVRGVVHDESAYILSQEGFVGSAGLFSTVPDLLNLLQMIIQNGEFEGKKILNKQTIKLMSSEVHMGQKKVGLGWELNSQYMGKNHSEVLLGKTGFTGCFIVFDPERKVGIIMLSNYHFPKRKKSFSDLNNVRQRVLDVILA